MIVTLLFCVDVKWQISQQLSLFPKLLLCHWQITPLSFWKHPVVIVETFKVNVYLVVSRYYPAQPFCPVMVLVFAWQLFSSLHLRLVPFLGSSVIKISKEYCAWFCQAIWLNLFLLLYCIANLICESASQGEGCCIIVENNICPEVLVLRHWIVYTKECFQNDKR